MDQETKEILLDLLKSMKLRAAAVLDLGADVAGLKDALPPESRAVFADTSQRVRSEGSIALQGELHWLDEAIVRLQKK
jgi:hypothetical protein